MNLGRCLEALRWNQQHRVAEPKLVPYRESKVHSIHKVADLGNRAIPDVLEGQLGGSCYAGQLSR